MIDSSTSSWGPSLTESRVVATPHVIQMAIGCILLVHVVATCLLMPPGEFLREDPLLIRDHSIHSHRIQLYREALFAGGWPWGYDPQVSAGFTMDPRSDVGAKPQEVLGVLLFFLPPGTVERVFVFLVVLTIPLWMLLSCRKIGLPLEAQLWVLATLLIPMWLYGNLPNYVYWGLVAFAASSYVAPFVLTLFLDFVSRPNARTYLVFCLGGAFLFFLHVLGPVMIVLPLIVVLLAVPVIPIRWRLGMLAAPVVIFALNAFWAIPFSYSFLAMPSPPIPADLDLSHFPHLATAHATYSNIAEVLHLFTPLRVGIVGGGVLCMLYGYFVMSQLVGTRITWVFGLVAMIGIGLKFFGSFIPGVVLMQPARFFLPTFVFLSIPIGLALYRMAQYVHLPPIVSTGGLILCAVLGATILDKPNSLASPPPALGLVNFVHNRTDATDRLLIQSMAWEPRALPMVLDREVIGNAFPFSRDPTQFLVTMLWGKPIDAWSPEEMRVILQRWGITWCFTHNELGRALFEKITKSPGEQVGEYQAFNISETRSRLLVGAGQVHVTTNHIELSQLQDEDGLVVLRYRYHPAWETRSGFPVQQYSLPEDPRGFIAFKNPPESLSLVFNSRKMLSATWPNQDAVFPEQ